MITSYCCCTNEPVIFSHSVHLKRGHRFHTLLKVCSDRDDAVPLEVTQSLMWFSGRCSKVQNALMIVWEGFRAATVIWSYRIMLSRPARTGGVLLSATEFILGHRFHALSKVCSDRNDTAPLRWIYNTNDYREETPPPKKKMMSATILEHNNCTMCATFSRKRRISVKKVISLITRRFVTRCETISFNTRILQTVFSQVVRLEGCFTTWIRIRFQRGSFEVTGS